MSKNKLLLFEVAPIEPATTHPEAKLIDKILGTKGKGDSLLKVWHSLASLAQNLDAANLTQCQREKLQAAFQIHFVSDTREAIHSPADIFHMVSDLQAENQEHLVVLCFDRRNNLIYRDNLYKGNVYGCSVRIAEVFRQAIIRNASAVVIVHNHPSGAPRSM